ncbi:proprotein convertase subtilisin/kexin type 5-like [Xyrauchen texanus]|uniref:proprotein convertase subtilisin/kexin type 5-like n=1 Tax=Xyrauchen texanus TaxID=154827 RepID=UPI002241B76B|nr:proprotein convertase subtilisin/kexin type 5-like [Xyrauchen texanus]
MDSASLATGAAFAVQGQAKTNASAASQNAFYSCPDGYYVNKDKQECVQCHVNCASCSGHHSNDCLTCKPGLLLLGHSCFPSCPASFFVNANYECEACDHTCEECSASSSSCLSCRDGYFLLRKSGNCLHKCPSNYFPDTFDRECRRCHTTCETCSGNGALSCTSCYNGFEMFAGICSSACLSGQYPVPLKTMNTKCADCDPSCTECKGPGPYNCSRCPALQRLSEDGRCLPCCGDNMDSARFPWECCHCHELNDECIVTLNYKLLSKDPVPSGHPGLVVFTVIFVLVSLWLVIFLFLHFRTRIISNPIIKSNGYSKIADGPFTSATLKDSIQTEYCDKDEGQEEDEEEEDDIVYMGRDGIVYRKFKYSQLDEEEEEEEEVELEYDDEMYTLT